jgi:hypothetical protein
MEHSAEYQQFTNLVDDLLSLSHEGMQKREAQYRKKGVYRGGSGLVPLQG